jgi:two-component system, NarL family, sensor kinase
VELAIFRLVQECLTNIYRHSGSKTALIRVVREGESVRTEVRDHGNGIPPERLVEIQSHGSGVGIRGIRERIRPFRGEMKIESNGAGTSVIVSIPTPKEAHPADSEPLQAAV